MKNRFYLIAVFLLLSLFSTAQEKFLICGNDSIQISMENQTKVGNVFNCAFKFEKNSAFPDTYRAHAEEYLKGRMGNETGSSFRLRMWGSFNVYNDANQRQMAAACCCDTLERYAAFYEAELYEDFVYTITLIYDKRGNIISEKAAPELSKPATASITFDPCKALELANEDEVFTGAVESMYLNHIDSLGGFCWVIEKEPANGSGSNKGGLIFIHASTGKVVHRETFLFRTGRRS